MENEPDIFVTRWPVSNRTQQQMICVRRFPMIQFPHERPTSKATHNGGPTFCGWIHHAQFAQVPIRIHHLAIHLHSLVLLKAIYYGSTFRDLFRAILIIFVPVHTRARKRAPNEDIDTHFHPPVKYILYK